MVIRRLRADKGRDSVRDGKTAAQDPPCREGPGADGPICDRPLSLYAMLRPRVAHIARGLLGEWPPTELVHDICVEVSLAELRFRGDCAFSTWIYSIVCNQVRNWIRAERNHRNLIRAAAQLHDRHHVPRPDETIDTFVLVDQLKSGFALLTQAQRTCLILVGGECLSPQEAADRLHTTPTAVRMNIHRARARLRRWLELQ